MLYVNVVPFFFFYKKHFLPYEIIQGVNRYIDHVATLHRVSLILFKNNITALVSDHPECFTCKEMSQIFYIIHTTSFGPGDF